MATMLRLKQKKPQTPMAEKQRLIRLNDRNLLANIAVLGGSLRQVY
jgi:hypothetical protein